MKTKQANEDVIDAYIDATSAKSMNAATNNQQIAAFQQAIKSLMQTIQNWLTNMAHQP